MTRNRLIALGKGLLHYVAIALICFMGAGFLGFFFGSYVAVSADSRHYFHAGIDWAARAIRNPAGQANSFEAKTVSDIVPFIELSHNSLERHWKDKHLSEVDVLSNQYFRTETLSHGTKYIPWLWTPDDPETPLTVMNDQLAYIVVVLIEPHGVEPKVGMIPLDDYEEFLRRTGVRKGGR